MNYLVSVDLKPLLIGSLLLYFGGTGVIKSIQILFFKKNQKLPIFGMVHFLERLFLGKNHTFYKKQLAGYRKVMTRLAKYYLISMPFIASFGFVMLRYWFIERIFSETNSVDLMPLIFGTILLHLGLTGVVKSIQILFFKKTPVLPLFGMMYFLERLLLGKEHPFYKKQLAGYQKVMKPFAIYSLIVLPFFALYGFGMLFYWFRDYIF